MAPAPNHATPPTPISTGALAGADQRPISRPLWPIDVFWILCLLALTAAVGFFLVLPRLAAREDLHTLMADLELRIEESLQRESQLRSEQGAAGELAEQIQAAGLQLVPFTRMNERVALLMQQAGAGLRIDEIRPAGVRKTPLYVAVPITVAGVASFPQFTELLFRIRACCPDMAVSAFEIRGTPDNPAAAPRFSLELMWYAGQASQGDSAGGWAAASADGS